VKYPGRVEKEKTVQVVRDHEGGTRIRLATWFRDEGGNVGVGSGLLGSQYSGGAIFGNSKQTSTGRRGGA